ncbi:MAG: hypothetical protein Q9227_002617 [Pyrenula ochraceoflavens]
MASTHSSAENTDYEGDDFEDAPDSTSALRPTSKSSRPESVSRPSTRSLTDRRTSSASMSPPNSRESSAKRDPVSTESQNNESDALPTEKETSEAGDGSAPTTTARKLSATEMDMDEVKLSPTHNQDDPTNSSSAPGSSEQTPASTVASKPPPLQSRFTGFSASLPSVPWGQNQSKAAATTSLPPPTQPPPRKLTSPFSWLGRGQSASKENKSPPMQANGGGDRRNTAASVSTLGSNAELTLKALDETDEGHAVPGQKPPTRTSLRDQFKMLRLREEAGITSLDDSGEGGAIAGLIGRSASVGLGIGSPTSFGEEKKLGSGPSPATSPKSETGPSINSTIIDPNLAPGRAAGAATSTPTTPIDWDFWQSVVNEGPQAVARTSPEELTQAIASGIPQTIRGVIWQVLASSKNDDLENVYRELIVRGTEKETSPTLSNGYPSGTLKESSVASSRSSVHSDQSTPATSTNIGLVSPTLSESKDPETNAKLQAALLAERKKKAADDAASLKKLEKMIKRDMGSRTSYSKYAVAAGFQDGLFNVCKAYALFDESVGYPQGMNFIIMPLLFNMPEEEAFCILVRLMNKYQLRDLFIQDMPGLHLHLYQFERLLEDLEPALYCHLNRRGVTPKLYATQWFLTLFAYRFPLQLVMRVYDLVLSEGLEGAILKFGMAVIQRNVQTLLAMQDMLTLTNFLKEKLFDVYIDKTPSSSSILESGFFGNSSGKDAEIYRADLLVQDACSVKVTPDMLQKYRSEWDEKVQQEKARELELDNYRSTVLSQAAKIRKLEERTEKSDTEHVQIASELVKVKVENEELLDKNESLKVQVDELKKVAEGEGAAVEARLKDEMERVMKRNLEVQNENRQMEESMAEMEKDLVNTKMSSAEVHANYETLQQKWNDLRKALD